jgi:hypothetical protein
VVGFGERKGNCRFFFYEGIKLNDGFLVGFLRLEKSRFAFTFR